MSTVQSSLRIVAHCGNRHRRTPLAANLLVLAACSVAGAAGPARAPLPDPCARPAPGSAVPEPQSVLPTSHEPLPAPTLAWLGSVTPTRVRRLYFSEKLDDPNNPNSATTFYITVDRQTPRPFDPRSSVPNIVVTQGDVEDWIIENRSTELHAFHIHQIHFMLMEWSGFPVNDAFVRDTVNVPYFNGRMLQYPSVRLRIDFRDPNAVGTFVYHWHVLEHEDGGMMGTVRVRSASAAPAPGAPAATANER
jgi:FtsP/CotA-like multicopper oxidase with cupredoxin domain